MDRMRFSGESAAVPHSSFIFILGVSESVEQRENFNEISQFSFVRRKLKVEWMNWVTMVAGGK